MNGLGLCVSPGFVPGADELAALRPAFLRSILLNVVDDLESLLATGLPILLTLNNQADMAAGWAGWDEACSYIGQRARGQLIGLTAGNELDVYWARNQDDVPPSFAADLIIRAQRALRPFGIPGGTTSLGGPRWVEYVTDMLRHCEPDFVALNPYGWIFDGIEAKIEAVRSVAPGLAIKFPELGCKIGDAGGEEGQARALTDVTAVVAREGIDASWFAWRDQVGAPNERGDSAFGLVAEDGRRRPAWSAFAALATAPIIDVIPPGPDPIMPPTPDPPGHTTDPEPTPMPPTNDMPRGIDVASYQGYPDWPTVASSGVAFAITKATEGVGYVNPTFAYNWSGIKAAGMIRGAYHFGRPSENGAISEAEFFANHVEAAGLDTGDLVVLDLEDTNASGDLGPWVLDWLRHVEGRLGVKPLVYTGAWYSEPHGLATHPQLADYGLWLASYQDAMPAPPSPWPVVAIWQYTDSLSVPGIAGDVDGDLYNGDLATLSLYGKPAAAPAPPADSPSTSTYAVGEGLLAAMAARGDQPSTDEVYYGVGAQYSEAIGVSGTRYLWVRSTGRVHVYAPAA